MLGILNKEKKRKISMHAANIDERQSNSAQIYLYF